ncbi:amino acid permease [Deinococcus sp. KNUC1210]|uniref:APC family permease n=1 Tax=Deinococcus sp. KNUC1210 TaxID=2917691 RepID=UPI001EEFD619|nr:amino acid permease [Deinococcus sp. KNUC1210]ULH14686.1 amino acid permease [Deinococcus sp. KNUC1210]
MTTGIWQKLMRTKSADAEVGDGHGHGGELKRTLGLFPLVMLGVGATIGTGIFFAMGEAVPKAGPAVIWSFVLAGLAAALTALCYAELASSIPASGSAYSYTYVTIGEFVAYIVGACLLLEYALAASATSIGWSEYLNNFLQNSVGWSIPEALRSPLLVRGDTGLEMHWGHINLPPIILVCMCCFLLLRGARESATVNAVMVIIKIAILAFFSAVAFSAFKTANFVPFNPFGLSSIDGAGNKMGIVAAAGTIFFSFIGLDTVATAGAEVKNPKRNVPLGIILALIIVVAAYIAVAVAAMGAQPASAFKGQEAGLAVILQNVLGAKWPAVLLSAGAVISVFSVTLVTIYGQTRILFAIGRDGLIPKAFQSVNPRTLAPVVNTVIVCVVVGLIGGFVDSAYLWDMVSMGTLVAFSLVSIGVIVMRYKAPNLERGFKLPFGPWVIPVLSVAVCMFIIKDLPTETYQVFFIWMTVVIVGYFLYGIRHSKLGQQGSS